MFFCTVCGKQNPDTAKFCIGCGKSRLKSSSEDEVNITSSVTKTGSGKTKLFVLITIIVLGLSTGIFFIFFDKKRKPVMPQNVDAVNVPQTEQKQVADTHQPKQEIVKAGDKWTTEHSLVYGIYTGTIGYKKFTLKIEAVSGNKVKGYNITGTNKRPVEGVFTEVHGEFDQFGDKTVLVTTNIYSLILKEPGTDEWDGEFKLRIELCDWFDEGKGTWKSYNGKLNRTIKFSDAELEKLLSGE